MDSASIGLRLIGTPPSVEFLRGSGVPDDLWYSLHVHLKPRRGRDYRERLVVPIEQFLANRGRLHQLCRDHRTGVTLDSGVQALLKNADRDAQALRMLLTMRPATGDAAQPIDVRSPTKELTRTRYVRQLRDFQERDLKKVLSLRHGANFSVPGAGKTAVTYALYELERLHGRVSRLLVVAPLSAFDAWENEATKCFHPLPLVRRFNGVVPTDTEVLLVNYQKLAPYYEQLSAWLTQASTHLVLDEAHRAKAGRAGEWGEACLDLAFLATRRDILTGTPAPQGPADFWALVDFLWPNQARHVLPRESLSSSPSPQTMTRVSRVLQPLFVRTTKSELGLDAPCQWVEQVELGPLQAQIYDALRNRYSGMFDLSRPDRTMLAQMGEVTIYLLQAATNPALLAQRLQGEVPADFRFPSLAIPAGSALADLISKYPQYEIPAKLRKLAVIVEQNASLGRKTLVWSNFPGNLLTLEQLLGRYQPALIYGAIPSESSTNTAGVRTREGELARFRSDPDCMVLLANPAAMAEGVSLHQVCHDAVYLDRTFNAGQYLQSLDRIHRLGLERGVETRITYLLARNSIDEAVKDRVASKAERLAQMLNDPDLVAMALPDDEDYGESIEDIGDLTALFEHLRGSTH